VNLVFWNICHLLDLQKFQLVVLIEQHQNYGLGAVCHKDIGLCCDKDRPNFYATKVRKPRQIAIGILLLVKTLKLDSDLFYFGR
jgi:hypothetical protein